MNRKVLGVDAATYRAHDLHRTERVWLETNCYVDLWIELLNSLQLDPVACMAFTLAMDFEGDQWTFFKQPHADLYRLYGVDVQELAIWRPVLLHAIEQVELGRIPLVEVDSFYLPDTAGVAYGVEHTKTTIAISAIDPEAHILGYFHNAGYFELSARDFEGLFSEETSSLAPYTEIVKLDRVTARCPRELRAIARDLTRQYVERSPRQNPFTRYRTRYAADIGWLSEQDMAVFYKYAFATLRQCGACAEMASTFLLWLPEDGDAPASAAADFATIASSAKAMQFKIARMIATKKPADVAPLLDQMEEIWDRAAADLARRHGS